MGLLGNGSRFNATGYITSAPGLFSGVYHAGIPASRNLAAFRRNMFAGEAGFDAASSVPEGVRHPAAWIMAQKPGGMAANVIGAGQAGGDAIAALELLATLIGAGDLDAAGGLIVNLAATLVGSGEVSDADIKAFLNLVAIIAGAGGASGSATGLGALLAAIQGAGSAASTISGIGALSATLRGFGDLTPEGLRDAVWNALAAQYNTADTMGAKLNAAGSGGVDLNALAAAVWAYASRSLSGAQANQLRELFEIHGLDPAKPLEVTDTTRSAGAISQAVASSAPPSGATVSLTRLP